MSFSSSPSISILIPSLNADKCLEECLTSIKTQNYPQNKIEIILSDGGSTDNTLSIARRFGAKIYSNPLKTAEAGKAVALRHAKGELVALIDTDNLLPEKDWLKKMVEPFTDKEIIGSEPWEFTYRRKDSYISRYCALIGANDPYCYFVGNYDKKSVLSGKWTGLNLKQKNRGNYIKVEMQGTALPTIGANGTIWRRETLTQTVGKKNFLFDTDIPYLLAENSPFYFAKVKVGIIHLYCQTFKDFYRKQKRRVRDFYYLEKKQERQQTYQRQLGKQLRFIFSTIFVIPLFYQSIKGYFRKPSGAWLFHPIACLATLWIYGIETALSLFKIQEMNRRGWKQ